MAGGARDEWAPAVVLRWAVAATVLLGVVASSVSIVEVQRVRHEVDALSRAADRSSFLVGDIGRQITRLRAKALDRLLLPGHQGTEVDERFTAIGRSLDQRLSELDRVVQPRERGQWERFFPLLAHFRERVAEAMNALRSGRRQRGRAILVHEVQPLALRLQDHLDALGQLNADTSVALLAEADRRLARVRVSELVLGIGLVIGLGIIWWAAFRALGRQRRQLEEYLARIERSNRDLDAFAGRVAHDLRNALGPIALIAAALREARERPDAVARMASQLGETVRRSRGLIDGLLAFSRPVQSPDGDQSASVATMANDVLEERAPLVSRVAAEIDVAVEDLQVLCPPGLLHVVGANLIGNALKYLEGRPVRRVRIAARVDGDWVEFAVEDTGPGIPANALPYVWQPFYRVPGTAAPGSGIGLATVRRIVEAHGGQVGAESEVGRGSVFRVRLPLAGLPATRRTEAVPLQPAG